MEFGVHLRHDLHSTGRSTSSTCQTPTLLLIGTPTPRPSARTLRRPRRATLGNYPVLGKAAAARIPRAQLIEFPDLGHSPQIQDPRLFNEALLRGLDQLNR